MPKLAINGGSPLRRRPFQTWPIVEERDVQAVADVVRSGDWGRLRPGATRTQEFEQRFAAYHDCRFGLCVTSGTAALEVALVAAGVDVGDEVIVPPYTFMATATAVLQVGAVPVFVDIDPETYNLDPALIESAVTEKTRAVIPVHFGGLPAHMDAINAVARRHDLRVIEDAAHAHGGVHASGKLGSLGHAAAWSFQASKNLTSGEGGCVTTNDPDLYNRAVLYHDFWRGALRREEDTHYLPGRVNFPVLSWNYRMTEFCGALLLSQLDRLEGWAARRDANAVYLASRLAQIEGLANVRRDPYVERNAVHIFLFKYRDPQAFRGVPRHRLVEALAAEGIPVSEGYFAPVYRHPVFQDALRGALRGGFPLTSREYGRHMDYREVSCPQAEHLCAEETLWIGQAAFLGTKEDMDDIADALAKIKEHAGELAPGGARG
jgi:dTDP-4-amino-4,6-dideoxygalactose transaminase